jgi:hypothetical protein
MTTGIKVTNDDGNLSFSDSNDYYIYQEQLTSSKATVMFGQRFYWTTTYSGSAFPIVFIWSNNRYGSIVDTFRNANGTWQIHVWTAWNSASDTASNMQAWVFVDSSQASTSPSYGIRINNASGTRVYDSDMDIIKIQGFGTVPASGTANASCSLYLIEQVQVQAHGISGMTKPAALLYHNNQQYRECSGSSYFWKAISAIDGTNLVTSWLYMGGLFGVGSTATVYPSQAYTTPIIDGNDY